MKCTLLILLLVLLSIGDGHTRTNYYIDSRSGNDNAAGTSEESAWQTIDRLNRIEFQPGDSILFRRGCVWTGNFRPKGSGSEGNPIVAGSYGAGALPRLNGAGRKAEGTRNSATISLFNQQYWEFCDLDIRNFMPGEKPEQVKGEGDKGWSNSIKYGILIEGRDVGTLRHIHFKRLEISEVNGAMKTKDNGGIFMNITWDENPDRRKPTCFEDVLLENCFIHDVDRTGFSNMTVWWNRSLTSQWGDTLANKQVHNWYPSHKMVVRKNRFERTGANALIVRAAVSPLIEHNLFVQCATKGSGNASFPFNCDGALFQYNEAMKTVYNTEATSWDGKRDADAGGFDSDWNCKNTIIQFNYSHDNEFGGVLVCCDGGSKTGFNHGTIIRYNIFENNGHHQIRTSGPATNSRIYNNLIYSDLSQDSVMMIYHKSWAGFSDSTLYQNNIFVAKGKSASFQTGKSTRNFFRANLYRGAFLHLPDDREAIVSDPEFVSSQKDVSGLMRYFPAKGSPLIDSGIPVEGAGKMVDFFGNAIMGLPDRGPIEFLHKSKKSGN